MKNNLALETAHLIYRPSIDGLRAIAVISVLISHIFPKVLPGGFVGVDVFFIISGFLIGKIILERLESNNFSFFDFYSRRVRRIFPVLIIVLIFTYVVGWFTLLPVEFAELGKHIAAGALFSSNLVLWSEAGYFSTASELKPLLHLWSLGIEEQFYLVWPLLLWIFWRKKNVVLVLIAILISLSFLSNLYLTTHNPTSSFFLPFPRFWELCLGSLIALLSIREKNNVPDADKVGLYRTLNTHKAVVLECCSVVGLIFILLAIILLTPEKKFPGYWALLPTLGASLIIVAGENTFINRKILSSRLFVFLGLISYPLYLWHWPIIAYYNISQPTISASVDCGIRFAILFVSIFMAWLSYNFVEKNLRLYKKELLKFYGLLFFMAILGGVGFVTFKNNGFIARYPAQISELIKIGNVYEYFKLGENIRDGKCHSTNVSVSLESRIDTCAQRRNSMVFLWGDSYAAVLYSGLEKISKERNFGIAQFTVGNAPPFFEQDKIAANNKNLNLINSESLEAAKILQPEIIIISWMNGGMNAYDTPEKSMHGLAETVKKIRSVSANSRIVVVGPVPEWDKTLVHSMIGYWKNTPMHPPAPTYMKYGLRPETEKWDSKFKVEMPKIGVTYISALDAMCREDGCLTRVGPKSSDLTAVDSGHLTKSSSEYFVKKIEKKIFAD